ncbi:hypothetical protein A0O30_03150 [Pseudomonas sp. LLC-1]|nr:hypothetical protein A0O30_03150 [Pseudomonas sp. LLC-1]
MAFSTLEVHMLFYLDASLLEDITVRPVQLLEFLENLCSARRNGRHLIFADKSTIEQLMKLPGLSPRAHRTLSVVVRRIRGKLPIFQACRVFIRVVHGDRMLTKNAVGGKTEIFISIDMINGDELFAKPKLLVENRTDGEFYTALAKLLIDQQRSTKGLMLAYELVGGGGSQTPREYEALKLTEYLVYCIVDADVDFPKAPLGGNTAAPVFNSELKTPKATADALILNCYSAENLIHPLMIKSALNLMGTESWYLEIEKFFELDFWQFLALKARKTCIDFEGVSEKNKYWAIYRPSFAGLPCPPPCVKDKCSIFTPLKNTTLIKVADYLNNSLNGVPFRIPDCQGHVRNEWEKIKDGIISWACSGGRIA